LPALPLKTFSLAVALILRWIAEPMSLTFADTLADTAQLSCQLNKPHLLKYKYSYTCEKKRHRNHFTAIKRFLRTESTPEIEDVRSTSIAKLDEIDNIDNINYQKS